MNFKRYFFQNKNFKPWYYIKGEWRRLFVKDLSAQLNSCLEKLNDFDEREILQRVAYYNKLDQRSLCHEDSEVIATYFRPKRNKVYFYDSFEYLRYFSAQYRFKILFGDITTVPDDPSIVKSRPIYGDNKNSIVLNLDKIRHFNFIKDDIPYSKKKDMLVGRATVYQEHRKRFYELYFNHPICNLGDVADKSSKWYTPKLSITKHLDYKFILALEGYDVATNLKWIMSSNSIAVMPKPTYETWFMEGTLIPDFHYIEIKADYSDLEERLSYYIEHPDEALTIVENAQRYIQQFKNPDKERLISLMTLKKYFESTGQC